jgi:methylated-DNA-[protein]-cysteine S-methyltransferase
MTELYRTCYSSEIGVIEITATSTAIKTLNFVDEKVMADTEDTEFPEVLQAGLEQLDEYFRGKRSQFALSLELDGTVFQKKVWHQLLSIPFGKTASYLEIALAIGNRNAVRAVGAANGKNPISIIVPCHRVIGNNGKLTGYGGGLWRKEWLLKHEGWQPHPQLKLF